MTSSVWHHTTLTSSVMWPFETAYATSCGWSQENMPITGLVFESFENFYITKSPLMSRGFDRQSMSHQRVPRDCAIVLAHYAVDDYDNRWSNFDKICRSRSVLKVVRSWLWRHSQPICLTKLLISAQLWCSPTLERGIGQTSRSFRLVCRLNK